ALSRAQGTNRGCLRQNAAWRASAHAHLRQPASAPSRPPSVRPPRFQLNGERAAVGRSGAARRSTGPGGGLGKRPASSSSSSRTEDECKKQHVPFKLAKPGFSAASQSLKKSPISIKLGASKPKEAAPAVPVKKPASVFDDDDSEPEEMPPEAKMRMKNIGRDTPTSAGPNSFNKGKQGFSDHQKLWERKLKSLTDK
uniref:PEST proteolytic signal-containing nuclear protein n=1 Tax=Pygocentrus nattereri TaxID=42514 RepID=A0A3B4ELX9_PYGNA